MAARRGKSQARRNSGSDTPGWVWLVAGAAIAAVVFLAAPNVFKKDGDGFLRVGDILRGRGDVSYAVNQRNPDDVSNDIQQPE